MSEHTETRRVAARLARIEGHVRAVKRMVEDGRPCSHVLLQMAAVRAALDRTAKIILADHMEHCLGGSGGKRDAKALAELKEALERFIR